MKLAVCRRTSIAQLVPYRQSSSYDVWGNTTRGGYFYSRITGSGGSYTNNRVQGWSYDAAGNGLQDYDNAHTFDAAGQQTYVVSSGPGTTGMVGDGDQFPYQPSLEISQTYDGAGQPAKRIQTTRENVYDDFDENHPLIQVYELTQTSYYLRSTALGGAQIMDLGNTAEGMWIFAGGERLTKVSGANLQRYELPRPCGNSVDATALRRGDSRSRLQRRRRTFKDATALRRGVFTLSAFSN